MKLSILPLLLAAVLAPPSQPALAAPLVAAPDADSLQPARAGPVARSKRGSGMPLAKMLGLIAAMCPVDMSITAISDMMTTAEKAIAAMVGVPTTEDGMADIGGGDASGADCGDITVIFARGTTEAGNVGVIAGPPFFNEIERRLGNGKTLVVQGVDYPANVAGFLAGGDRQGSQTMANLVRQAFDECPNSQIVMSGYSQGGQLVHNAARILGGATMARVSSVVIFGDPNNGQPVAGASPDRTLVICNRGDNICDGGFLVLPPHLTYGQDAGRAASFVIANANAVSN